MNVPLSLLDVSAKCVAFGIRKGIIKLDVKLDSKSSNAIFRELILQDGSYKTRLDEFKNVFDLTIVNFTNSGTKLNATILQSLSNFNLTSITLGSMSGLEDYFTEPGNQYIVDIVKIAALLPNLESINISDKYITDTDWFSEFCIRLPNLRVLDISSIKLNSFEGIKFLTNLEILKASNLRMIEDYRELSELKKLKVLDISKTDCCPSNSINVLRKLVNQNVKIPILQLLDCSQTIVTENDVKSFIEAHPQLRSMVLIGTGDPIRIRKSAVKIIDLRDLNATNEAIEYSYLTWHIFHLGECLRTFSDTLSRDFNNFGKEDLQTFLKTLCSILNRENSPKILKSSAVRCFSKIFLVENLENEIISKESVLREVTDCLLRYCRKINNRSKTTKYFGETFSIMDNIVAINILFADSFCSKALDLIENHFTSPSIFRFLIKNIHKTSRNCFKSIVEDSLIVLFFFDAWWMSPKNTENSNILLNIVQELTRISEECRGQLMKNGGEKIFEHFSNSDDSFKLNQDILKLLKVFTNSEDNDLVLSFFNNERVEILLKLVRDTSQLFEHVHNNYLIFSIVSNLLNRCSTLPDHWNHKLIEFCSQPDFTIYLKWNDVNQAVLLNSLQSKIEGPIWWAILTIRSLRNCGEAGFLNSPMKPKLMEELRKVHENQQMSVELREHSENVIQADNALIPLFQFLNSH